MKIRSVHLRRFRGLERASLPDCAALNVLIGRNNAGKSSMLAAIELALERLQGGRVASIWRGMRPFDQFTGRDSSKPFQIGVSFQLNDEILNEFRNRLLDESPGLDVAVSQLQNENVISIVFAGDILSDHLVLYAKDFGFGDLDASGDDLLLSGTRIISLPQQTALELGIRENKKKGIEKEINSLVELRSDIIDYAVRQKGDGSRWRSYTGDSISSPDIVQQVDELFSRSSTREEVEAGRTVIVSSLHRTISDLEAADLQNPLTTFSGTSKKVPNYASWLMIQIAKGKVVSFKEVRKSVGREEASQLLELKLRRGGTQSLARIQETVRALLGVEVDAFQADNSTIARRSRTGGNAEMDIDDFLVEANGAGIREALRIILDLELGSPVLATVEEPEVHLHPGLERVVHRYLVEKSKDIQLFVATHSANFLDSTTRQNVYLVSREKGASSTVEQVASENDLLLLSQEIGLRPSTVLMFDRLIFVEGPSDEAILVEISKTLGMDFAAENATFVQMSGSSGFSNFAADSTLDLLSRRRIKMWFILDHDERDDDEIARLTAKLGDRAQIRVLDRRELENYLLDPTAIQEMIIEKSQTSSKKYTSAELGDIETEIGEAAGALLERSVTLAVEKKMLSPVYARYGGETVSEKLSAMANAIGERVTAAAVFEEETRAALSVNWPKQAAKRAPGAEILQAVFTKYGMSYNKTKDGPNLARRIEKGSINSEIKRILSEITKPDDIC